MIVVAVVVHMGFPFSGHGIYTSTISPSSGLHRQFERGKANVEENQCPPAMCWLLCQESDAFDKVKCYNSTNCSSDSQNLQTSIQQCTTLLLRCLRVSLLSLLQRQQFKLGRVLLQQTGVLEFGTRKQLQTMPSSMPRCLRNPTMSVLSLNKEVLSSLHHGSWLMREKSEPWWPATQRKSIWVVLSSWFVHYQRLLLLSATFSHTMEHASPPLVIPLHPCGQARKPRIRHFRDSNTSWHG